MYDDEADTIGYDADFSEAFDSVMELLRFEEAVAVKETNVKAKCRHEGDIRVYECELEQESLSAAEWDRLDKGAPRSAVEDEENTFVA